METMRISGTVHVSFLVVWCWWCLSTYFQLHLHRRSTQGATSEVAFRWGLWSGYVPLVVNICESSSTSVGCRFGCLLVREIMPYWPLVLYRKHRQSYLLDSATLRGSWDLVSGVINKVTILIIAYNPN